MFFHCLPSAQLRTHLTLNDFQIFPSPLLALRERPTSAQHHGQPSSSRYAGAVAALQPIHPPPIPFLSPFPHSSRTRAILLTSGSRVEECTPIYTHTPKKSAHVRTVFKRCQAPRKRNGGSTRRTRSNCIFHLFNLRHTVCAPPQCSVRKCTRVPAERLPESRKKNKRPHHLGPPVGEIFVSFR